MVGVLDIALLAHEWEGDQLIGTHNIWYFAWATAKSSTQNPLVSLSLPSDSYNVVCVCGVVGMGTLH